MAAWGDEDIMRDLKTALDGVPVADGIDAIRRKIVTTKECPTCRGTGESSVYIHSWTCPTCAGKGRILRV